MCRAEGECVGSGWSDGTVSQAADDPQRSERPLPPWTECEVARQTEELMATLDPKRYVGSKHHVVPRFILKRFANDKDQVLVRDRTTDAKRISNTKALAVTDFYTFIDTAGELNASYEQMPTASCANTSRTRLPGRGRSTPSRSTQSTRSSHSSRSAAPPTAVSWNSWPTTA